MAKGDNQYSIIVPGEQREHIIVGDKASAIEARDKFHPNGIIYLTYSEETGYTRELIDLSEDYMNSNCQNCSFGKGSQQCENCYVGGY